MLFATLLIAKAEEAPPPLIDLDGTVLLQFGLFVVMYILLRYVLFAPYLRMRADRDRGISGARDEAHKMEERARAIVTDYDAKLGRATRRARRSTRRAAKFPATPRRRARSSRRSRWRWRARWRRRSSAGRWRDAARGVRRAVPRAALVAVAGAAGRRVARGRRRLSRARRERVGGARDPELVDVGLQGQAPAAAVRLRAGELRHLRADHVSPRRQAAQELRRRAPLEHPQGSRRGVAPAQGGRGQAARVRAEGVERRGGDRLSGEEHPERGRGGEGAHPRPAAE